MRMEIMAVKHRHQQLSGADKSRLHLAFMAASNYRPSDYLPSRLHQMLVHQMLIHQNAYTPNAIKAFYIPATQ